MCLKQLNWLNFVVEKMCNPLPMGIMGIVKGSLYDRKPPGCLTCICDLVHWPSQQSVSRMRQGHNQVLVFTWRHAFSSDSVIDVYVNVFKGGL